MADFTNNIVTTYRKETSINGYNLSDLKSAFQKYIRRGNIDKAIYVAGELDLFKLDDHRGEVIRTNFINRLLIIYLEDICNIGIFNVVSTNINKLFSIKKKSKPSIESEIITELVSLYCLSKKARICSHVRAVFSGEFWTDGLLSKYPDILGYKETVNADEGNDVDNYTKYFNEKNVICIHYAFKLANSTTLMEKRSYGSKKPVWVIFSSLVQAKLNIDMNIFINWYKYHIGKNKESFLCWLVPLLYYLGMLVSSDIHGDIPACNYWKPNMENRKIVLDDFVFDIHTQKGNRKNGNIRFATEGAMVENEAEFVKPSWKAFYEDTKKVKDVKETDYKLIVRTQLNTSKTKQDVYFATLDDVLYVVKGPFESEEKLLILDRNTEWKKKNNLPFIEYKKELMIPNRWKTVPLGIRNTINDSEPHWFLIFNSVIDKKDIKIKSHKSKLWPPTNVVDWAQCQIHIPSDISGLSEQEHVDYMHALIYRYIRGIPDLADRNFIRHNGRVISIDEDLELRDVNFKNELKQKKCGYIENWLKSNYHLLNVDKWILSDDERKKTSMSSLCSLFHF